MTSTRTQCYYHFQGKERYCGIGFLTDTLSGETITQVGNGGSCAGHASTFVLRPEANLAVSVLANADVNTIAALSFVLLAQSFDIYYSHEGGR